MSRVLNIKINHEGIVLDGVICEGGRSQFTDNEEQYGYRFWDDGLEELTEDAYGTDLEYCYAGEFNKLKYKKSDIGKLINQSDYAIIQYLIMLPEKYIVVLYWH